ncbi:MAG: MgtC/SapB family protein [Candidatus Eremiobacteraeota bacterium]|nr:MgtC/SapB family protein [Candidatus Eremiobacteraeota bacterium]
MNWGDLLSNIGHPILAALIVLPIALDRERKTQIMGLRTYPLVAMGACAYVLVALTFAGDSVDAQARIIQGLLTAMGVIGGGAILKDGNSVKGTACAASVWITGAVGTAVAFHVYELAVLLGIGNFFTLRFLGSAKERLEGEQANDSG